MPADVIKTEGRSRNWLRNSKLPPPRPSSPTTAWPTAAGGRASSAAPRFCAATRTFGIFGDGKEVAAAGHGQGLPPRRLAVRLLPRPDVHVGNADVQHPRRSSRSSTATRQWRPTLPRAAARWGTTSRRASSMTAASFCARSRCPTPPPDVSNVAGWMPRLVGPRLRLEALPREPSAERRPGRFLDQRQRGRLRHHRRRGHQRGTVLGGDQRDRRAAGAGRHVRLGRRLRHLGADHRRDHEGLDLRRAARLHSRRPARDRHPRGSGLGLSRAGRGLRKRGRARAARAQAGPLPHHRADPAAGPLDQRQPRALQDQGAACGSRRSSTASRGCATG